MARDVFILGAGFSRAISKEMPLMVELSACVREKVTIPRDKQGLTEDFGDDFEAWLTYLSTPHPWLSEADNLRNRALFFEVTASIQSVLLERVSRATKTSIPGWLKELVAWWRDNGSQVLSLNYDPLVERAFCELGDGGVGELYTVPLTPIEWRFGREFWGLDTPRSKVRLYKLHGSINWLFSGSDSASGETIYYWGDQDKWSDAVRFDLPDDKVPLLLPPVANKGSLFHHETIRSTWIKAAKAVRHAKRVFNLGYSLPISDELIRFFLLRNAPTSARPLYIADIKDTTDHFEQRIGKKYMIDRQFAGIEEPIPRLLSALKRGALELHR